MGQPSNLICRVLPGGKQSVDKCCTIIQKMTGTEVERDERWKDHKLCLEVYNKMAEVQGCAIIAKGGDGTHYEILKISAASVLSLEFILSNLRESLKGSGQKEIRWIVSEDKLVLHKSLGKFGYVASIHKPTGNYLFKFELPVDDWSDRQIACAAKAAQDKAKRGDK